MKRLFEHEKPKQWSDYTAAYIRVDAGKATNKERVEALKALYVYYFCDDPHNGTNFDVSVLAALSELTEGPKL